MQRNRDEDLCCRWERFVEYLDNVQCVNGVLLSALLYLCMKIEQHAQPALRCLLHSRIHLLFFYLSVSLVAAIFSSDHCDTIKARPPNKRFFFSPSTRLFYNRESISLSVRHDGFGVVRQGSCRELLAHSLYGCDWKWMPYIVALHVSPG